MFQDNAAIFAREEKFYLYLREILPIFGKLFLWYQVLDDKKAIVLVELSLLQGEPSAAGGIV